MSEHASMNCPVCKTALTMSERQGIEIDFCQTCRGVWLDRGELDKIVERSAAIAPAPEAPRPSAPPTYRQDRRDDHRHYDDRGHHGYHGKRRKSFFEELFD